MIDVGLLQSGVFDGGLEGLAHPSQEVGGELLELGAAEGFFEVKRALGGCGDEGEVDRGRLSGRQFDLGLLGCFLETLRRHLVGTEIDAVGVLELTDEPVDDGSVPVVATEFGVAGGALHFEHAVADFEDGDVEGAAAEVEHEDRLIFAFFVEAVGQRCRGGLVDDSEDFETSDLAGFLRGGALGIVEVGRHRDDGLRDGVAQVGLGVTLELHERASADFLRGVLLAVDVGVPARAHVALDGANRAVGVGDGLTLGDFADQNLTTLFCEGHHGGRGSSAF